MKLADAPRSGQSPLTEDSFSPASPWSDPAFLPPADVDDLADMYREHFAEISALEKAEQEARAYLEDRGYWAAYERFKAAGGTGYDESLDSLEEELAPAIADLKRIVSDRDVAESTALTYETLDGRLLPVDFSQVSDIEQLKREPLRVIRPACPAFVEPDEWLRPLLASRCIRFCEEAQLVSGHIGRDLYGYDRFEWVEIPWDAAPTDRLRLVLAESAESIAVEAENRRMAAEHALRIERVEARAADAAANGNDADRDCYLFAASELRSEPPPVETNRNRPVMWVGCPANQQPPIGSRLEDHLAAIAKLDAAAKAASAAKAIADELADSDEVDDESNGNERPAFDEDGDPGIIKLLADAISRGQHFAQDAGKRLYFFSDGAYHAENEDHDFIARQCKMYCEAWKATNKWRDSLPGSVANYIRIGRPRLWDRPSGEYLNLQNGLLRLSDRKLLRHSAEHLSPIQLPVAFDPTATCPEIDRFMQEVFPEDAIDLAWEIAAFLIAPHISIQKAILLIGAGGNGKSVFLDILKSLIGGKNTSAASLHDIENNRFTACSLVGKLANICGDLPSDDLGSVPVFKKIIGGDEIQAEYKHVNVFSFRPFCRLIFSTNHMPRSRDSSQSFFDRWLVVPFNQSFRGTDREILKEDLIARLTTRRELSGLLNRALAVLGSLAKRKRFLQPESTEAIAREFRSATDPLARWLDEYTVDDSGLCISKRELRVAFNAHQERKGMPVMTDQAFGRSMKSLRPSVEFKQRNYKDQKKEWCFVGIGMRAGITCAGSSQNDAIEPNSGEPTERLPYKD